MQSIVNSPTDLIGQQWDQYALIKALEQKEFFQPYAANDSNYDRKVLIQVLKEELPSLEAGDRLASEISRLSLLRHPNISQIFEIGTKDRLQYIVAEYIEGVKLSTAIKHAVDQNQLFALNLTLRVVYSISLALAYAHKRGVVHGELTTDNIIIEETGRVVLTNFGLMQLVRSIFTEETQLPQRMVDYAAPEVRSGQPASIRSDIYSLGVVFYQLSTGHLPYTDGGEADALIPPRQWEPDLS